MKTKKKNARLASPRNEELRRLMAEHSLSLPETAAMIYRSPHTVEAWLRPATSQGANKMPMDTLVLLRLKLGLPEEG